MKPKEMEPSQKELKDIKDKNNELAQHLQHWKSVTTEKDREIRSLRKQILHQKNSNTALNRVVQKFIEEFNILSKSLGRFSEIIKEFTQQSALFEDAELVRYSNIGCSPLNNIQHVQPMVQGHSILKPVITLARTVIDSRYTQPPTSVRESSPIHVMEHPVAQPVMQLLESFVSLERVDSEISRMSDENVTTRRPRQYQDQDGNGCILNGSSILFDSLESVDESRDDIAMDMDRLNSDDEENDTGVDSKDVSEFFRPGLAQIDEEDPNETDRNKSLNLLNGCSRDSNLVPMVLLQRSVSRHSQEPLFEEVNEVFKEVTVVKREVSEEVKEETPEPPPNNVAKSPAAIYTYNPRPGPSWQSDSDEEERSGKEKRKKKKKQNKRNKKSKSTANDKENLNYSNHQNSSDDDSDNSRYDAALHRMLITKRAYDSLKPVKVMVNKLETGDWKMASSDFAKTNGCNVDSTSEQSISADSMTGRSSSNSIKIAIRNSEESDNTRLSSRSHRSAPKDYKELSIRKKLRRD